MQYDEQQHLQSLQSTVSRVPRIHETIIFFFLMGLLKWTCLDILKIFVRFERFIGSKDSSIKKSYNLVSRRVADFFGFNF